MNSKITINSDQLVQNIDTSHRHDTNAIMARNQTFITRLFPGRLQRSVDDHRLKGIEIEMEFRRRALKVVKDSQLQAIQETYNHYLLQGKALMRREIATFFADQAKQLEVEIDQIIAAFYENIEKQYQAMEKLKLPALKEREKQRLEEKIDKFLSNVDDRIDNFYKILSEEIKG